MKISCIKSINDNDSFKLFKSFGFDIYNVEDYEKTDEMINKLVDDNYKTIWITNELAYFSGDIIKKYEKSDKINIIIAPKRNNEENIT